MKTWADGVGASGAGHSSRTFSKRNFLHAFDGRWQTILRGAAAALLLAALYWAMILVLGALAFLVVFTAAEVIEYGWACLPIGAVWISRMGLALFVLAELARRAAAFMLGRAPAASPLRRVALGAAAVLLAAAALREQSWLFMLLAMASGVCFLAEGRRR